MAQLLGLVLISFTITGILIVPFIDLLFHLKRRFEKEERPEKSEKSRTEVSAESEIPITNKLMKEDIATPSGGGILLILILLILSNVLALFVPNFDTRMLQILSLTLLFFGGLGFVDDLKWITTKRKGKLLGLGRKVLFFIQLVLAFIIGFMLYHFVGINNLYIPVIGNFDIGIWYIPFAAFAIVAFANAYNISDGLDGLSTGLLTICLFAFLALASATQAGSLNITLAAFIGIWIGALIAYLYFNVYPARIFLGDAGAFGFGATLAVVGLLTGKIAGLTVIGAVYIIIVASSLLQILSKKFLHRKLLPVAPLHMYFKYIGWEEPKIVARFWLAGAIFAIFGLWLALLSG
jgi:phospho-N-acetylmuramoyl-pentapeptide-transferase